MVNMTTQGSVQITMTGREVSTRWPLIERYLRVKSSGQVEGDYLSWYLATGRVSLPSMEMAAAYEEWADFYEFRLEQRADELAEDHHEHGLVTEWTADMAYCAQRCAAVARGADPGEPVPLSVRRPDLYEAKRARVAEIIAELPEDRRPAEALDPPLLEAELDRSRGLGPTVTR